MKKAMTVKQAMNLLGKICAEYQGTLGDHQVLQEALKIVDEKVNFVPPKKENVTKKK